MTKALTITPKLASYKGIQPKTSRAAASLQSRAPQIKTSKATRGLIGNIIDIFKALATKIAKPENAVNKISTNTLHAPHKDPAALVMKSIHG